MAHDTLSPGYVWGGLFVLLGAAAAVGVWAEGGRQHDWLREQEPRTPTVSPGRVDPAHDGQLVHVTGRVEPRRQVLRDARLGVSAEGFALARVSEVRDYVGGDEGPGDIWLLAGPPSRPNADDTSSPPGTAVWMPKEVRLGAFTLSPDVVCELLHQLLGVSAPAARPDGKEVPPPERVCSLVVRCDRRLAVAPDKRGEPPPPPAGWWLTPGGSFYRGGDPERPRTGDRRISYRLVQLGPPSVTVLARQAGKRLEADPHRVAGRPFVWVALGSHDRTAMFEVVRQAVRSQTNHTLFIALVLCAGAVGLLALTRHLRRKGAAAPAPAGPPVTTTGPV